VGTAVRRLNCSNMILRYIVRYKAGGIWVVRAELGLDFNATITNDNLT